MLERYLYPMVEKRRTIEGRWIVKNRGGKTWEIFFPLIPGHSDWCYQGVFLVTNTKGKNERKGKEKKKGMVTIRRRLISVRAKKLYVYPSKNNAIRNKRTRNATNWTCSENLSSRVFAIICDIEILMLRSLFQLHEDDFYLFYFNMEKLL